MAPTTARRLLRKSRTLLAMTAAFGLTSAALSQTPPVAAPAVGGPPASVAPATLPAAVEAKGLPAAYEPLLQRLMAAENRLRELEARPTVLEGADETPAELLLSEGKEPVRDGVAKDASLTDGVKDVKKSDDKAPSTAAKEKKWYDKLSIRGYTQIRMNETVQEDSRKAPAQSPNDGSVGDSRNVLIRRARIIISGDVSEYMAVYIQTDLAANVPGSPDSNQFTQLRDLYADLYFDKTKIHRVRVGQSKIPFGWENLQSSSNRIPLDRDDGINTAARNERDLGLFYYYTPLQAQELYKVAIDKNLKGSGNYGVFGIGFYNGQGGSFLEQNNNVHTIARLNYPFLVGDKQIVELGVQAYTGKYTVLSSTLRANGRGASIRPANTLETGDRAGTRDERIGWSAILLPQPFGFQAEWNVGRGPALNNAQTAVEETSLQGGYVMALYKYDTEHSGTFFPFIRYQYYRGGFKAERNAPYGRVNETEIGLEWQPRKEYEFTVVYTNTDRTNTSTADRVGFTNYRQFDGDLLRMQLQINY